MYKNILLAFLLLLPVCASAQPTEQDQKEPPSPAPATAENRETGSIRLGDLDLVTEEYVVQEGDWMIKVLREKGVPAERDIPKLLKLLKELNSSFRDLNLIRPGEKIMILVKAGPSEKSGTTAGPVAEKSLPESAGMKKTESRIEKGSRGHLKYEAYKIRPGDSIGALAITRYGLSRDQLFNQYYPLFRECNPSVQDLDRLLVGQHVRLPLYPPVWVTSLPKTPVIADLDNASGGRVLIHPVKPGIKIPNPAVNPEQTSVPAPEPSPNAVAVPPAAKKAVNPEGIKKEGETVPAMIPYKPDEIGHIFKEMGSDWIDSGEHFIPLKSGGQINLKASSYPVIRLNDGVTVILDPTGELPKDMSRFIHSTWNDYRIVQLDSGDDLRSALDKVLKACGFKRVVKAGEPLLLGKDIRLEIKGDWILSDSNEVANPEKEILVLNLVSSPQGYVPENLKRYLKRLRVHMIEYPPGVNPLDARTSQGEVYKAGDRFALIEALLKLAGYPFSAREQIPAFTGQKEDFQLVVNADFFVKTARGNTIFDLTGLDPKIIALLKKRKISVLSLADEKDPLVITDRILNELQMESKKGPHRIEAIHDTENIQMAIVMTGILFKGVEGKKIIVTPVDVPEEISAFLLKKDYGLLSLSGFASNGSASVK